MDEKYAIAFDLITKAGNAKASALLAIQAARDYDFEKAQELLKQADEEMVLAHHAQFELIQNEAQGKAVDINVILVHAQDHMAMAIMAKDNAEEFIHLYQSQQKIEEELAQIREKI